MSATVPQILAQMDEVETAIRRLDEMVKTSEEFRALIASADEGEPGLNLSILRGIFDDLPTMVRNLVSKSGTVPLPQIPPVKK